MRGAKWVGFAIRLVTGLTVVLAVLVPSAPAVAEPLSARTYRPPTEGAVLDPFRPPPEPWLAGNRGIEYATEEASALVAIGPGVVAFAGSVAGRLVVSIDHPDGLRSALTGVASIDVAVGQVVMGGQLVARAGPRVHLGVRRGDTYLDPASLWGRTAVGGRAVLVPDAASGGEAGDPAGSAAGPTTARPSASLRTRLLQMGARWAW